MTVNRTSANPTAGVLTLMRLKSGIRLCHLAATLARRLPDARPMCPFAGWRWHGAGSERPSRMACAGRRSGLAGDLHPKFVLLIYAATNACRGARRADAKFRANGGFRRNAGIGSLKACLAERRTWQK